MEAVTVVIILPLSMHMMVGGRQWMLEMPLITAGSIFSPFPQCK
jgi:hypothetical protein